MAGRLAVPGSHYACPRVFLTQAPRLAPSWKTDFASTCFIRTTPNFRKRIFPRFKSRSGICAGALAGLEQRLREERA